MTYFTFKPFVHPQDDPLQELREVCLAAAPATPALPPLRKIVAVGAKTSFGGLSFCDEHYAAHTFRTLAQMGVAVSSSFELTVLDISNGGSAHDFLNPRTKVMADLLMINFVRKPESKPDFVRSVIGGEMSKFSQNPNVWLCAGLRSKALVVASVVVAHEVGARDFLCGREKEYFVPPDRAPKAEFNFYPFNLFKAEPYYLETLLHRDYAVALRRAQKALTSTL